METQELFWNASIEALTKGYTEGENGELICLICSQVYDLQEVFPVEGRFFTATKMMQTHIEQVHGSMFKHMMGLNKSYTSISDNQKQVLEHMHQGHSDKEIAVALGISESTIRNYRFKFREKEKQAKAFLAIMNLLRKSEKTGDNVPAKTVEPHKGATQIDERYQITAEETQKIINAHMNEHGGLKTFPAKEKKKIVVLREIAKNFKPGQVYTEKEINRVLKRIYDDYALIRRYLIQYGFLDRRHDGGSYWVK